MLRLSETKISISIFNKIPRSYRNPYLCGEFYFSMKKYKYYFAAFSAFFIWGFFSLGLKPISNYPSLDILFYRLFFSVLTMSVINLVFRRKNIRKNWNDFSEMPIEKKRKIILLTRRCALILASNWFIFIYVVNHVSVKAWFPCLFDLPNIDNSFCILFAS